MADSAITQIAAQMATSLKTTSLVNAARGQISKVGSYPVAEIRFENGGESVYDFNSINRVPYEVEITVRGKSLNQVETALAEIATLFNVGDTAYVALQALDVGFFDILFREWDVPDEKQAGAEVIGYALFDMRVEYTYT